jgi:hypothetical protein
MRTRGSGAAPVLERAPRHPPNPCQAGNAPGAAHRARDTHPPGGGAPPQTHQSARAPLALVVGTRPPDLATIWRVYVARFSIEPTFRFFKQVRKLDDAEVALARGR